MTATRQTTPSDGTQTLFSREHSLTHSLTHTRGNSRKLMKNHSSTAHVFHNRVVNFWNKLPNSVVQAPSTASFKNHLFKFVNSVGVDHFLTF